MRLRLSKPQECGQSQANANNEAGTKAEEEARGRGLGRGQGYSCDSFTVKILLCFSFLVTGNT